jgi:hypothetical protein
MKKIKFISFLILVAVINNACGPSACDCAKLLKANYDRGLFWQYGMTEKEKQKTRDCMDKYDGYLNAEKKCK